MEKILSQLDLQEYTSSYEAYLARQKPLFLEGDIHLHFKLIQELVNQQSVKPIPSMINLDRSIAVLQKSGVLRLEEIYAYVKIIKYFSYLKKIFVKDLLASWMDKIVIPENLFEICDFFNEKGELKNSVDETFESINRSLHLIKEDMSSTLRRTMSGQKLSTYLVDRQVHYINDQEALLLRGGFNHVIKGSVIGRSSSGFFYVTPDSITKLKSKQNDLIAKKEELTYQYCKSISSTFSKSLFFLKYINKEFDRYDAYQARVNFAKDKDMEFVLPKKSTQIKLDRFSHPALHDPKPINLDFSKQVLMITGVNAGGKTMLLKSILSAAFMAKYLLPMKINPDKSVIGSFKELFAILDDPQNVKNDISTFAGRMTQFAGLFGKKSTLVGVDEIELGTDADEAASLFKVIIEKLIDRNMKIVITTHHKRLASLLATHEQVELLAAIYDEKNQRPTYGFLQGTIGKSYAFETALRYGVPATLVSEAREVYGDDKEKLNDLIQKNIDLELKMREQSIKLNSELEEIQRLKVNLKDEKESYKAEFDTLKSKMNLDYTKAIKEAKEAIKTKDSKEAHRHLNKAHEYKKATHKKETIKQEPIPLKVGDRVKYGSSRGLLKSIKKDIALIECDGMQLRVPLNTLKRSGNVPKKSTISRVTVSKQNANSTVVLDLHGQRGEEAVENLDKFISDALIQGYEELRVYHGIGTGKLAYAVREFLKIHPSVESFCDAPPNQGGFGATIVKL
ncbi:endonuclease MutS2 [Sulfurospirillum arcachonense]|uniref:endonuclease MutS2 n=1 Tax=Sulfurospirillum arcachonense TaxID=57666 RepID=UPI00046AAD3B|nr:endonuclease MutS2 [Sulfurospirillum arcachonense]